MLKSVKSRYPSGKTLSLFIFLTMISYDSLFAQSGWFSQTSGTQVNLNSVYFTNSATGWATGDNAVLRTTNGGLNWIVQDWIIEGQDWYFRSIHFTNALSGWLVGLGVSQWGVHFDEIYKTTDGGLNWIGQYGVLGGMGLNSVYFTNSTTGWAVGTNEILMTTNGGQDWFPSGFNLGENDYYTFNSICFTNSTTGFVAGSLYVNPPGTHFNVILKTIDDGLNWTEQYRSVGYGLNSIHFPTATTGWAVGGNRVLITTNSGTNWTQQQCGCFGDAQFSSVYFTNSTTGWLAGSRYIGGICECYRGVIYATTNGGDSWIFQFGVPGIGLYGSDLNSIYFTNSTTGWAVGGSDNGIILKTTDGGLTGVNSTNKRTPEKFSLSQNYPNPFNPTTIINYQLPMISDVNLTVYNSLGEKIAVLMNERQNVGIHEVEWDASKYGSGVYFYRLTVLQTGSSTGELTETKKMILLK